MEKLASIHIPPDSGDFALFDRKVVDIITRLPERSRYLRGLRSWVGFRQKALVFKRHARAAGQAHYTLRASLQLALDGVFSFSTVPLRMATYLGFGLCGIALGLAGTSLLLQHWPGALAPFGLTPEARPSGLALAVTLFSGVQLVCMGILGEYLGRIYNEVKARPTWIIARSAEDPH